ncbi:MAG: glycoside hydrolase domain-containing protein, partial [Lentisphaeria bacterium]
MKFIVKNIALYLIPIALISAPKQHPDFEPISVKNTNSNLLINAKISASNHWGNQVAKFAIDGESANANNHWACLEFPAVLNVDLEKNSDISSLKVWPYWSDGRIYKYKVEGSLDQNNWTMLADHTANSIAASANGDAFNFPTQKFRYLRLTVTDSTKRENGAHIVEFAAYATTPNIALQGGIASINERYNYLEKLNLLAPNTGINLTGWRGERVNAQVVVYSEAPLQQLRFDKITLTAENGETIQAKANFVRYVQANKKVTADILDDATMISQAANINRPIWLPIDIPSDAKPGIYQGNFLVRSENGNVNFPIKMEVLPATLPLAKNWNFQLDLWQTPLSVARWHDLTPWSDEHFALLKPIMQRLANAGQKNITSTLLHEAWNAQTYDWTPSMIEWIKNTDGSWQYDYTIFDKWVDFMINEIGISEKIVCYTMVPWTLKYRYYDKATEKYIDLKAAPSSKEYDDHWGPFLQDFVKHLRNRGWLEKTYIGLDERPDHLMIPAMNILKKYAPELQMVSAINYPSKTTENIYEISPIIGHANTISDAMLAQRKAKKQITTFYVCTAPAVPNTFTFSPPAESTWMPIFAAAKNFDGFLRWAYNAWVENPLQSTDYVRWPSGDCFLVYPGNRSSIRFELL